MTFKTVQIDVGDKGWGGPLDVTPSEDKPVIACITGGDIHPVAARIAELTGGEAIDAFRKGVKIEKMACIVVDCGGSARCGIYPQKGVKTINVVSCGPSGFLGRYMKPEIYVSGVKPEHIELIEE